MLVVYKLLTAQDKNAQKTAIKMLTLCCHVDNERRTQRQAWIAEFDNGAIALTLVQKVQEFSSYRKLSIAKAQELGAVLQLISSAAEGGLCSQQTRNVQAYIGKLCADSLRFPMPVLPAYIATHLHSGGPHDTVLRLQPRHVEFLFLRGGQSKFLLVKRRHA